MLRLFRKKPKEKPSVLYSLMQKAGEFIERRQRRAADYLNRKVAGYSKRQLKVGMFLFCLLFGGATVYVVYYSFSGAAGTVRVQSIRVPESAVLPNQGDTVVIHAVPKAIIKIRSFHRYLDSLQQTKEGRLIYDSVVRLRPGLRDSLEMTLKLYEEQIKTSEYDNDE